MAKFFVTYKCGCEDEINIVGPLKERQAKADACSDRLCTECWKAAQQAKEEAQQAKEEAAVEKSVRELPALQGSEKQVASIHGQAAPAEAHSLLAQAEEIVAAVAQKDSASEWIDRRNRNFADLKTALKAGLEAWWA